MVYYCSWVGKSVGSVGITELDELRDDDAPRTMVVQPKGRESCGMGWRLGVRFGRKCSRRSGRVRRANGGQGAGYGGRSSVAPEAMWARWAPCAAAFLLLLPLVACWPSLGSTNINPQIIPDHR